MTPLIRETIAIGNATLYLGDCLEVLRTLPDSSVDSIVTDPPYGLGKEPDALAMLADWLATGHHDVKGSGFMGKAWDAFVPQPALWRECLRVLKPGGHLLAFAGTRTHDLMTLGLRIAGFEIRDTIMWVYGSGFPKSLDVSKAIDKAAGAERTERRAPKPGHEKFVGRDNMKALRESGALSGDGGFSRPWMHDPQKVEDAHWDFAPATDAARQWQGWGTALKPALEPITVARKPLIGTVAENVLQFGTGALNVDGCRVGHGGTEDTRRNAAGGDNGLTGTGTFKIRERRAEDQPLHYGRWPANLIHDGIEEVLAGFPTQKSPAPYVRSTDDPSEYVGLSGTIRNAGDVVPGYGDSGSAARFFYCAKASKSDRGEGNNHPTVKPTDLMRYLCRLVTPPCGVVLDPFMGSGSTGKAAMLEGFRFIGIEREPKYFDIACRRIEDAQRQGRLIA